MRGFPTPRLRRGKSGTTSDPPFFFYGTLLDDDLVRFVTGLPHVAIQPANLSGWRRMKAAGRAYPIIVRSSLAKTSGGLAHGLGAAASRNLARYEGPEYRSALLPVRTSDGRRHMATVFLPRGNSLNCSRHPWRLGEWQKRWKPLALRMARRLGA